MTTFARTVQDSTLARSVGRNTAPNCATGDEVANSARVAEHGPLGLRLPRRRNATPSVWAAGRSTHALTEVVKQLDWIEGLEEHRGVKILPFGGE